jgi:hypothetical protein
MTTSGPLKITEHSFDADVQGSEHMFEMLAERFGVASVLDAMSLHALERSYTSKREPEPTRKYWALIEHQLDSNRKANAENSSRLN